MEGLDLFKLHSKKDKPHGWIWVGLDANLLRNKYLKLIKNKSRDDIARRISKKLNSGFSTIYKHLTRLKRSKNNIQLPLPVVIELINLINPNLKNKIINSIILFLCKTDYQRNRINAVKRLDVLLAKIIGAHIADGYLQKVGLGYSIKISDGREDTIKICAKWIEDKFNLKPRIRFDKRDNTWTCWFNNKIIGRYFENIFDMKPGKKSHIAKEPILIKRSTYEIRKAFALGVLTFDGGVKTSGTIALSSMSKSLINDIYDILALDAIKVNKLYNPKKGSWLIESVSGRDKNYLSKWEDYFERGTWKLERLNFFLKNKRYDIKELEYLFPKHHFSILSIKDVLKSIKNIKNAKIADIRKDLNKNRVKFSHSPVYKCLFILEKAGLIYKTDEKVNDGRYGWREVIYHIK